MRKKGWMQICIFIFQLILEFLPRTPEQISDEIHLLGHHIGKEISISMLINQSLHVMFDKVKT